MSARSSLPERIPAMDEQRTRTDLQASYDRLATQYVEHIYDELKDKPLDRALLDRLAARARKLHGLVCDVGCGPGQVARYLHERGARVCGVDLSAGMIEQARRLNPNIEFNQGDMLALDVADEAWAGIAAFYSIIHIPREEVLNALRELRRALKRGGTLLLAFHLGEETLHLEELWDVPVKLDFNFFTTDEMSGYLSDAGFEIEEVLEREPYENVEHPSRRGYIFARKPASPQSL